MYNLTKYLPKWSQPNHPLIRFELGTGCQTISWADRLRRAGRIAPTWAVWVVAIWLTYAIVTGFHTRPLGETLTESLVSLLLWPNLVIQMLAGTSAIALTGNTVKQLADNRIWSTLRATELGINLMFKARWASVFYKLRFLLGLLALVRLVLIMGILWDLTGFRGHYLDLLITGVTPQVPLWLAVVLLGFLMTASLLLPFTSLGFDAAVGLLIATVRSRAVGSLLQLIVITLRILGPILLFIIANLIFRGQVIMADWQAWLAMGALTTSGDWGVSLLHLGTYGSISAIVPYGIFLGGTLIFFALVQILATDRIMTLAVNRADRVD